jgi:hypothetical protein
VEHVVFFPAPDGSPAFRRFGDLPEAVRFVEHLRNIENVSNASVYALTEVPLSFKAWYRVELPASAEEAAAPDQPRAESAPETAPAAVGSATGLLVPDQPLVADQFAASPVPVESAPEPAVAEAAQVPEVAEVPEHIGVQDVLAPTAGRRERGIGFFAR